MNYKFMLKRNKYSFSYKNKMLIFNENSVKVLSKEISFYLKELSLYQVNLKTLCNLNINSEVKDLLLNIAYAIIEEKNLYSYIKKNKTLPVRKLSVLTSESPSFIEKWSPYILAYILLLSKNSCANIKTYLNIKSNDEDSEYDDNANKALVPYSNSNSITGLLLKLNGRKAFIITSYGDFVEIKLPKNSTIDNYIGTIVTGNRKKNIKLYKYPILISILSIIFLLITSLTIYNQPYTTIVMEGSASIKIQSNRIGKIISINGSNKNSKKIISSIQVKNKDLNTALTAILSTGKSLGIIKERSTIFIYVNGHELNDSELEYAKKFVKDNKIDAKINNNGTEHKFNKN